MRKPAFAYAKTKTQISCTVTAQLISAYVFAVQIVQPLYYLNPKFQASSRLLWSYSPVCVGPGCKPRRPVFSQRGSFVIKVKTQPKITTLTSKDSLAVSSSASRRYLEPCSRQTVWSSTAKSIIASPKILPDPLSNQQ